MTFKYQFCPRCGARQNQKESRNPFSCSVCDLHLYRNPAAAVAGIILNGAGQVLLIRRAKEPARGKLAFPGGFVDFGETAEAALHREIQEELGLKLASISFLMSHPNQYQYRDMTYDVLDLFFVCETAGTAATTLMAEEVEAAHWFALDQVQVDKLAFVSMRRAWKFFVS